MKIKKIRLGSVLLPSNVLMAPLAGYTCYPFRMLCQELGAGLCYTEMVSSNALKYQDKATSRLLFTTKEEKIRAVQLLGSDPAVMEKAAKSQALADFHVIDINMGCPVPNIFKSGEGSALMGDLKRASAIIQACKRSGKPVTVKCRIGLLETSLIAAEFARMCEASGADMISVHGRSRNMMYDGTPYYDQIEEAKSAVSIPVIANGGIFSEKDADIMMDRTGADGVMVGRYALENPYIFSILTGRPVCKSRYELLSQQMDLAARYYDETFVLALMKKMAAYSMKKRRGTKHLKEQLYQCGSLAQLDELLRLIFK